MNRVQLIMFTVAVAFAVLISRGKGAAHNLVKLIRIVDLLLISSIVVGALHLLSKIVARMD